MRKSVLTYLILFFIIELAYTQSLQWQEIGRMPIPVKGHRAVALDSTILIIGGFSDSLNTSINLIQEFNPQNNSWRIIGTTLFRRTNFFVEKLKDSLIIFGGNFRAPLAIEFNSLEIWKRNFDPYILRYNPIFNRRFSNGFLLNQKLFLFGGTKIPTPLDTTRLSYYIEYDIIKDSISYVLDRFPNLPEIPFHQAISTINLNVFIFGGVSSGVLNGIYRFNLPNRTLNRLPINLLIPRAGAEAITIDNSKIIIIGGYNEYFRALKTTEIFTFDNNHISIELGPPLKYPRKEFSAVKFNNSIYIFGGVNQFDEIVPVVEKLNLLTNVEDNNLQPDEFILYQNYPNPFNSTTQISFKIPSKSKVSLEIFDIFGRSIKTLVDKEVESGNYTVEWNGTDYNSNPVASGIYLYRLSTGEMSFTKKMLLLK